MKKELIEREEVSRESGKKRDGKVSSNSAEEIRRIVMEDSMEGEAYMLRTVIQERENEPVPHKDVLSPGIDPYRGS